MAVAITLAGALSLVAPAASDVRAAAADLTLTGDATYSVQPEKSRVHITLDAVAVSHTQDTVTKRFFFTSTYLTILPGTSDYSATSGSTRLAVHVTKRTKDYVLLSIDFSRRLYSGQRYPFRLQFDLVDPGGAPTRDVRIGSSLVAFPVWAFASGNIPGSTVRVVLPAGFKPEPGTGDLPAATVGPAGEVVYQTGSLAAPLDFYAYLMADRAGAFAETVVNTAVGDRRASVLVKAWTDDTAWGRQVADLFRRGLPALGSLIGLPYPRTAQLTVEEAVSRSIGGYSGLFDPAVGRIQVAYYAEPYVVLHEAAHAWFNSNLASDRWIDEAFASYYAEQAARQLGIKVTATSLTPDLLRSRIQLNAWGAVGLEDAKDEDYAYAATLTLAGLIAQRAGPAALAAVWQAAAGRQPAYLPVHGTTAPLALTAGAPDWRSLLDLLEERTGSSFTDLWRTWVVRTGDVPLLVARTAARADYDATIVQAGDWELPAAVRDALGAWQFDAARGLLADARRVLDVRTAVVARATADGLAAPTTLRTLFESGGLQAALVEGQRELATLAVIESARAAAAAHDQSGVAGKVGLIGADPQVELTAATRAFTAGDLQAAVDDARAAHDLWSGAGGVGQVRIAVAVGCLIAALLLLAALVLFLRQRRGRRTSLPIAAWSTAGEAGEAAALPGPLGENVGAAGDGPLAQAPPGELRDQPVAPDPYATLAPDPRAGVAPDPATSAEAQLEHGGADPL